MAFNFSCQKAGCERTIRIDKNIGNTYLDSSNSIWTPKENDTVIFKNKSGKELLFTVSYAELIIKNNLFQNKAFNSDLCEEAGFVYSTEEQAQITYKSQSMPIKFIVQRLKQIPYPISDTTSLDMLRKYPEQIILRTLDEAKYFYIQDSENYYIGDTLLNDSMFSNLYKIDFTAGKSTKCFFIQKNTGLVGIAFTNGEIFSRR
jgi:hypothetical protein